MPILTTTFNAKVTDENGQEVAVHPRVALAKRGPVIQANASLSGSFEAQLQERGEQSPDPVSGFALIDTGASGTCIDEAVAQQLNLPAIDVVQIASASENSSRQNVYPVGFELAGLSVGIDAHRAVGAPLQSQGIIALIGRDVLQNCTLHYNGPSGQITISV